MNEEKERLQDDLTFNLKTIGNITDKAQAERRLLSDEEKAELSKLEKEVEGINARIAAIDENEAVLARTQELQDAAKASRGRKAVPAQPGAGPVNDRTPQIEVASSYRTGALRAFTPNRFGGSQAADFAAYKSGMWMLAHFKGSPRATRWCRENGIYGALSEGTNSADGYLVPDELGQAVIDLREEYGVARQQLRVIPMGSDHAYYARKTGRPSAAFYGEAAAIAEANQTYDNVGLTAKKLGVLTLWSTELDEDAVVSIGDNVAQDFALAFATTEDNCLFIGTGAVAYGNIVGASIKLVDGTHTVGAVDCATAAHDTFGEVDVTDISGMMAACPEYAIPNAKFYCSSQFNQMVFQRLKAAGGGNTITNLEGPVKNYFLGHEVVVTASMPAGLATNYNNVCICLFGDLNMAAMMGSRRAIMVKRSEEYKFAEDQIALKATERIDINVHSLGDTSVAGPIVGLVGFTS